MDSVACLYIGDPFAIPMELNKMDLRQRIKEETENWHTKIEQNLLFKKIILYEISLKEYVLLIQKFYTFIVPCEASINLLPCNSILDNRKKKSWLEQDLYALEKSNTIVNNITIYKNLPDLSAYEHVLGYLYVMEGSTLGGQIIAKILEKQLQITQDRGGRFFHGYGDQTKKMWNDFCQILCGIKNLEQQNKIIDSAKDTYNQLHQWMETSG